MPKFNLTASVTISVYTDVEAETLEKAIEIAKKRDITNYKWGDKEQVNQSWISDEFDGSPINIQEA